MRVEAKTLEEAYFIAAKKLNCSVTDLEVKIIQHPSRGFLGLFAKNAIIEINENIDRDIEDVIDEIKRDGTAAGSVVESIERGRKEIVGIFQKNKNFGFVVPLDKKIYKDF